MYGPTADVGIGKSQSNAFPSSSHAPARSEADVPGPYETVRPRDARSVALPEATEARIPNKEPAGTVPSLVTGIHPLARYRVLPGVAVAPPGPYLKFPTVVWNSSDAVVI